MKSLNLCNPLSMSFHCCKFKWVNLGKFKWENLLFIESRVEIVEKSFNVWFVLKIVDDTDEDDNDASFCIELLATVAYETVWGSDVLISDEDKVEVKWFKVDSWLRSDEVAAESFEVLKFSFGKKV